MSENPVNSSFSKIQPGLQIAWDSTSLGVAKTCWQLYKYLIIDGYTTTGESVHLRFGTMFHSAAETYDKARASGFDHEQSLLQALRRALTDSWDVETNRPWLSDEPTKTRKTLLRTLVWYLDHFKDDKLETVILNDGKPAVELSFRIVLNDLVSDGSYRASTGEEYILCGHLDKVVEWNGELWIADKKTTKGYLNEGYFQNYNPDNQVSLYAVAGMTTLSREVSGVIIDAAQVQVTGSRFMRRPIPRTHGQLEEWIQDLQFYLRQAETLATMDWWPKNDKSCDKFGGCQFRQVCGSDPSIRPHILSSFFNKRPTWDPLQPR